MRDNVCELTAAARERCLRTESCKPGRIGKRTGAAEAGVAGGNAVFSTTKDELTGMPRFKYD